MMLNVDNIHINFPSQIYAPFNYIDTTVRIGSYTKYEVLPTCGLASSTNVIGQVDEPRYFIDPDRNNASLLWFSAGFVEYQFPNPIHKNWKIQLIEISTELSSEFPGSNNNWPSDISFYIDSLYIGNCRVNGNYSDVRGKFTPNWWNDSFSQYGILKNFHINRIDSGVNGTHLSNINLTNLSLEKKPVISIRFAVDERSKKRGGLTIFGKYFGNYNQDIKIRIYYSTI